MQQSIPMINNQLSRIDNDIRSLDSNKNQHMAAAAVADNGAQANAQHMVARGIDSKKSTLEQEKQKLEGEKAQIEKEIADIDSKILQNEAEHKSLVDRKIALTG